MGATGDLKEGSSWEGRSPLQQTHQTGPFPVAGSPATGRHQPEWAVDTKERNARADAFQTSVCEGRQNGGMDTGGKTEGSEVPRATRGRGTHVPEGGSLARGREMCPSLSRRQARGDEPRWQYHSGRRGGNLKGLTAVAESCKCRVSPEMEHLPPFCVRETSCASTSTNPDPLLGETAPLRPR